MLEKNKISCKFLASLKNIWQWVKWSSCYGQNSLKQFIRGKPIIFSYKFGALCRIRGYCYNFDLYWGKSAQEGSNNNLLLESKVILHMFEVVENPQSHSISFDNLFTSYDLVYLQNAMTWYTFKTLDAKLQAPWGGEKQIKRVSSETNNTDKNASQEGHMIINSIQIMKFSL